MATVLIVEDNPANLALAIVLLQSAGHTVLSAPDVDAQCLRNTRLRRRRPRREISHHVGQQQARAHAMRNAMARPDAFSKRVAEPGRRRARERERKPRPKLALAARCKVGRIGVRRQQTRMQAPQCLERQRVRERMAA